MHYSKKKLNTLLNTMLNTIPNTLLNTILNTLLNTTLNTILNTIRNTILNTILNTVLNRLYNTQCNNLHTSTVFYSNYYILHKMVQYCIKYIYMHKFDTCAVSLVIVTCRREKEQQKHRRDQRMPGHEYI